LFDIAIVGFGATGVSLLKQIQDEVYASGLRAPRIALFSHRADFARGQAFGDAGTIHKVNTPPSMLSISKSEPVGFTHWMNAKGKANELYPNRLVYSTFLQETYLGITQSGLLNIEEIHEPVQAVTRQQDSYRVRSATGKPLQPIRSYSAWAPYTEPTSSTSQTNQVSSSTTANSRRSREGRF